MRKSYITKKNIGKVKSKTSRLIKSKKISRRRKRQNNKIQKVLKQSGGATKEELEKKIRERQAEYSLTKLRVFSSIITQLKRTDADADQITEEQLFKSPRPSIFGTIDSENIESILKLIKEILIELEKKIEILEIGQVMPQRTSANRRKSSIEFDNFINGIKEDKQAINYSGFPPPKFQDPTTLSTDKPQLPKAIKFLKDKRVYYHKFFNHIIIEFAIKNREKMKKSATTRRGQLSMASGIYGFGDHSEQSKSIMLRQDSFSGFGESHTNNVLPTSLLTDNPSVDEEA